MPFVLDRQPYVSTFAPADLGVLQHNLEGKQQRYDTANASWAQTKAALYEDPTYDNNAKQEVVKQIEGNFENIYKNYNGDLGAGVNDLMQMIGSSRKSDYFRLNKTALEEQKKYEALKQAYGAKGLEFRGMKQGLKDENGNWRKPEDFKAEVVQDLERDEKLASIIEQSLEEVSREGGLQQGDYAGMLKRVTTKGKGYLQGKGEKNDKTKSIYQEYAETPEGQLHLRILKDLKGSKTPEADLQKYVDDAIKNRIAPLSYSTDDMNAPVPHSGSGGNDKTPTPTRHMATSATSLGNPNDISKADPSSIDKLVTSKSDNTLDQHQRNQIFSTISKDPVLKNKKESIDKLVSELNQKGNVKFDNLFTNSYLSKHTTGPYAELNDPLQNYSGLNTDEIKSREKKFQILKVLVNQYRDLQQKLITPKIEAGDYQGLWYDVNNMDPKDPTGNSHRTQIKTAVDKLLKRVDLNDFVFEGGEFAGETEEDRNKKIGKSNQYKAGLGLELLGYGYDENNLWLKVVDVNNNSHIIRPKNKNVARTYAEAFDDLKARDVVETSDIRINDNDSKYTTPSGEKSFGEYAPEIEKAESGNLYKLKKGDLVVSNRAFANKIKDSDNRDMFYDRQLMLYGIDPNSLTETERLTEIEKIANEPLVATTKTEFLNYYQSYSGKLISN